MMETDKMIYTAIFQGPQGQLTRSRYTGAVDRKSAWLDATKMGASDGHRLIALVSGDHPVYFYDNFVKDNARSERSERSETQRHDVFDDGWGPDKDVYEMT